MKTHLVDGVEVHRGSGNVFADLGLADAEKLKIKTGLVVEIRKAMRSRGLTQQEAAKLMGINTGLVISHVSRVEAIGGAYWRIGCELAGLDLVAERELQRYIDQTQRRSRLLTL